MLDRLDETIVAVSSAPGYGAMGTVRLTGPKAIALTQPFAAIPGGRPLSLQPSSTRFPGEFALDGEASVPAVFYIFRTPHSYTRQDMVEIYTVGAPPLLESIRRKLIEQGALPALPGEFTARAFLHGAMDLASAEAVAAVIRAESDVQLRAARRMKDGALAKYIAEVRDELAELLALVEADIDFAEEPIEFITPPKLLNRLSMVQDRLETLVRGSSASERFDTLPRILLLGPPNAGKSTLMNRLSETQRAICAAVAGTTRDILSAPIRTGCGEAVLLDAAGVDRSEDEVLAAAREMSLSAAQRVDLVCLVVDAARPDTDTLLATVKELDVQRWVIAINKCDLVPEAEARSPAEQLSKGLGAPVCLVSAREGTNLEELKNVFARALGNAAGTTFSESMLISERQRVAIADADAALRRASMLSREAVETIDCADVLAFELREAMDVLGTVAGQVTTEDLLGQVFARFCIGK